MSARNAILAKVRRSLSPPADDSARVGAVAARLADAPRGVMPARGNLPPAERVALFARQAEAVNATVQFLGGYDELPKAVSQYLRDRNLPAAIRMGGDPRLGTADWVAEKTLDVRHGASDGNDLAGLSHAFGGIAETATLALLAGGDNPTTINFLPEYHLVVIRAGDIEGDMESLWDRLRAKLGRGVMTRVVNFVTGPSRSGDIEQKILLGAHGPRALHILIVKD
jgi:L-lactate dehydrogenase complex protein LldG